MVRKYSDVQLVSSILAEICVATKEEESEPLGQHIETFDPGSSDLTTYEQVLGKAQDAESQCTLAQARSSKFMEMPVHCQKQASMPSSFTIASAFGYSTYEENPQKLSKLVDSPLPKFNIPGEDRSPSNLALASSARATHKFSKDEAIVTKDTPDCGVTDCVVAVSDPDIPGFVDASENELDAALRALAGGPAGPDAVSLDDLLIEAVEIILGNSCGLNPVTGLPGIRNDKPSKKYPANNAQGIGRIGDFGNIRAGNGGLGGFRERSKQRHSGIDITAPVGTPAC